MERANELYIEAIKSGTAQSPRTFILDRHGREVEPFVEENVRRIPRGCKERQSFQQIHALHVQKFLV